METKFGESQNAEASIPSPQSEAVANDLQELSLQPSHNPLPIRERKNVLQLKLQQRRSREELVNQGIMPPLKSSAAFHEQRRSLERARTEDYLKRKIKSRPERSELIRMHILEETSAEPSLQAKQLQLKRARLADDLNDKISHRPGPMELIHKNILPVHSSIKQAIIETQFPKASGENSSCDEDSNDSLSPEQPVSQDSPPALGPLPSPADTLAGATIPSPTQVPPPAPPLPTISGSSTSLKLTNGTAAASVQRMGTTSQIKPKSNSDRSAQRHKKPKDNKPKIKKLKYHQYIPPDQKGDKEPPPHLDSSYAKILQQQQLFLQLQILSQQQQQHYNYHAILPAPPKPQTDQQPFSSSNSTASFSPSWPVAAPSAPSSHQSSAPSEGTKPASLPPNLDELKVAELKSELKLRSLPVSGTKNDLIERLRTYQELNGGSDTTSSTTAGGTTGLGAEGAGKALKTAATSTSDNISQQQQQFQSHQPSFLVGQTAGAGSSVASSAATPQQLLKYGSNVSPESRFLSPPDHSPPAISPEDTKCKSDGLGEMPSSTARLIINIKEEQPSTSPASCQLSLKPVYLQKHCLVSSAAPKSKTISPVVTMDKDKMLQEKDKQIEELTRMLRQKQRLVEVLRMQLEHGKRGQTQGQVSETVVLVRVKEEPPDKPILPVSSGHRPFTPLTSSLLCDVDVAKVTVKQEAAEAEKVVPETKLPDTLGSPQSYSQIQEAQEQIKLQTKPEQMNAHASQDQQVRHQQATLQLAQQQALQRLLLQQQHSVQYQQQKTQNRNQKLENQQNLQKLSQQRKKKSQKQQLKQQQRHLLQSQQHQHQTQLKQQILLKQQIKQQQQTPKETKQPQQIQIQTKIQLKHQQLQKQQAQSPQVSQAYFSQQSGPAPSSSLPLDLLKSDATTTLVTDSNGNHFLIALTSHVTENQEPDEPESKATNHITLQRLQSTPTKLPSHNTVQLPEADNETKQIIHMGCVRQQITKAQNRGPQVSGDQTQQEVSQNLSAPPSVQPFIKDQGTSGKNAASTPPQTKICPGLDYLFSPLSPAASSPDTKDTEHEDDFIDIILQRGEMSTFKPAPDPSLDHLHSSASSPPPSPLKLLLSPPVPPSCDTLQSVTSAQCEAADATKEKQQLSNGGSGRLEDFLESTTGKPLLGVEPGGLLTLIDDLHSQMLCTPSILDHPPSPMDTLDMAPQPNGGLGEEGLDSMDWLDLTMGEKTGEDSPTLAPLGSQTPQSVFSTDFLDSYDLQIHWDSCL